MYVLLQPSCSSHTAMGGHHVPKLTCEWASCLGSWEISCARKHLSHKNWNRNVVGCFDLTLIEETTALLYLYTGLCKRIFWPAEQDWIQLASVPR